MLFVHVLWVGEGGLRPALLQSAWNGTVLACNGVRIVSANPCNDIKHRIKDGFKSIKFSLKV